MSREDMQRTIDFILDQQAQFATNIQVLRETQIQLTISQAKAEVRMDRIEEVVLKTVGVVESLADGLDRTDGLVGALVEAQSQTDASLRELAAAQARTEAAISEAQAQTEVSLRELAAAQAQTEASLRELAAAQARTEAAISEAQVHTEASIREMAGAQARMAGGQEHTDHRLNALINVVERYISKGSQGDSV
jgi:chromosome segregation ATPase